MLSSLIPASAQTAGVFGEEGRGMEAISFSQTTNRIVVYARAGTLHSADMDDGGRGPPKSFLVWRRKAAAFVLVAGRLVLALALALARLALALARWVRPAAELCFIS